MKQILTLFLLSLTVFTWSQNPNPEKEWEVKPYGFVRTDYIVDTRKSANVRELNLNLYPMDVEKDANGDDKNAVAGSNFLSIVSRMGVKAKGPDVWGAKVSGTIEADFFGNTEGSIGLFRLRHAYVGMDWQKTSLTMGQTWYPSFIPEVFPGVANFNTGILFNPFGWATQVKLKHKFTDTFSGSVTAYKDREFITPAATGGTQNSASINSVLPILNATLQYQTPKFLIGLAAEYKSLQPLTVSNNLVSSEKVNSATFIGYLKYSNEKFTFKTYGINGSNLHDLVMLGGYTGYAKSNGQEAYVPIKTSAFWLDLASNGKSIAPGMFFGYTKNNGTGKDDAVQTLYARGYSGTGSRGVDNVWRASARIDFKKNKFKVSPELEYTAATWGDVKKDKSIDGNLEKVANFRTMITCSYSF